MMSIFVLSAQAQRVYPSLLARRNSAALWCFLKPKKWGEYASFKDENTVHSATTEVKAKRIIVAVGSRASAPPVPGLADTPYLTNENIGLELGQAFKRLGSEVEIIDIAAPLGRSEPEHAKVLVNALKEEGVVFHTPAKTKLIRKTKTGVGLTHAAGYHAGQLIRNFYFSPPFMGDMLGKANTTRMPAAIYSEPELASIGMTEAEAKEAGHDVRCVSWEFEENDRAIAVAMTNNIKISGLAQIISPYPTRSEAVKRAASSWYTDALFSDRTRKIAGFLAKFH